MGLFLPELSELKGSYRCFVYLITQIVQNKSTIRTNLQRLEIYPEAKCGKNWRSLLTLYPAQRPLAAHVMS